MKTKTLKVILVLAVALHMSLTAISYFASSSSGLKFYTTQVFGQVWNFFAPDPGVFTQKVFLKCEDRWVDPVAELLHDANRIPFYLYYGRTFLIRSLAENYNRRVVAMAIHACQVKDSKDGMYALNGEGQLDIKFQQVPICQEALSTMKKTQEYKKLQALGAMICEQKPSQITLIQKYPFPYSMREQAREKPYYQLSAIEL